ncbi:ATP/GTP-binding protein [Chitinophaga lutea]|uniref:ATP/GTP-binding protein n=1 Tax=Chitinophaga lutea TaxID=2488634 RepID=A0A3N4Q080_9BACT|nr:ATP/GTP-binding protein [Chitinophaga lutea]
MLCLLCAASPFIRAAAQQPTLEKLWTSDTTLRVPESVYFDAKRNVLYVANIDGAPWGKDGKGFISQLTPDGKITNLKWVEGLSAPKGMGVHGNHLYVADLDAVVVIDIAKGAIVTRHTIDGALNLNDITVSPKGTVYVSDSKRKKVHTFENGKSAELLDSAKSGLKGPNGLLFSQGQLLVLDGGAVNRAEKDNRIAKLVDVTKGTDGIEHVKADEYVVSCWQGEMFYVDLKAGTAIKMLDTQGEKLQTADIGYDAKKRIVYVPTFYGNRVTAYQLKPAK